MYLRSPSSFFAGNEDLGRAGKRQPILKPCQWVTINSKWWWGGKKPGIRMDKSSGHPRHSASSYLHFAILAPIRHSQASNFPPLRTLFLHRLPHSGSSSFHHRPLASLPYKTPPSPPSHSCSQQSEASVHSVYIDLGPEGPNRDWVFTSSLPPRCQRASWVFFFFEQGV